MKKWLARIKKTLPPFIKLLVAFWRSHRWLILLGLSSEVIYCFYLVRDFPLTRYWPELTDMGRINLYSHTGFLKFLLLFTVLFGLYALAWYLVRNLRDTATRLIILTFGVVFVLTSIFVYPATAIDIFVYIANGLVLVQHHANPLIVAPAQFAEQDPLMKLAGSVEAVSSPYGPLAMIIQALPIIIAGKNVLREMVHPGAGRWPAPHPTHSSSISRRNDYSM